MKHKYCFYCLFLIIFIFMSCRLTLQRRPKAVEVIAALENEFGRFSQSVHAQIKHNSKIEIYLDATGSMTGFIRKKRPTYELYEIGTTNYCDLLKKLDAYLRGKQDSFLLYKFGVYTSQIRRFDEAMKENFYDQRYTRLGELIESFTVRDSTNLPKAFLIFTDGIQSVGGDEDFRRVVQGVSCWLARGFHFEILAYRSEFNGEVFCETEGGRKVGWYRSDSFGLRPFYCYVFSCEPKFGTQIAQGLLASYNFSLPKIIDFSTVLFETPTIEFKTPARRTRNDINYLKPRATECGVKYYHWTGNSHEVLSGEFRTNINLNLTPEAQNFRITPYGIKAIIQCLDLDTKQRVAYPQIDYEIIKAIPESQPSKLEIRYKIKEINSASWLGYRIILLPGDGTVQVPQWVESWSTQSDYNLADFDKTLHFKEFVTSIMLRTKFLEQQMAKFYIAVKGRKK